LSWIKLSYKFQEKECQVHIKTSDARELCYHFAIKNTNYQLTRVEGSHSIPTSYEYTEALSRKNLPEGRFVEIDYQEGKVKALKVRMINQEKQKLFILFLMEKPTPIFLMLWVSGLAMSTTSVFSPLLSSDMMSKIASIESNKSFGGKRSRTQGFY